MELKDYKKFEKIIFANSQAISTIKRDLETKTVNHCYLLTCPDYITRKLFAILFAQSIICQAHDYGCVVCENIEKEVHPDVHWLPKNNENLKVEDAEKILKEVNMFGLEQDNRIFILDNFEFATAQMQNKLLKILEEPPINVYFLLMCNTSNGILTPIKSRCKKLNISSMKEEDIDVILNDLKVLENKKEVAKLIGNNYLGKTIEALENKKNEDMVNLCWELLIDCKTSKNMLKYTSQIANLKNQFDTFLTIYTQILCLINYYKNTSKLKMNIYGEKIKVANNLFSNQALIDLESKINLYNEEYKRSCNINLIADSIVLDILQSKIRI